MRGKQASRAGACHHHRSRLVIPSRHPCGRACRSRAIVPSSPHHIIPSKQADDGGGRPRGMGVGLVLSFLPGSGHDTGEGVMLSSSSRRSPPHQHLIPSPITISKRKPDKQAGGGRITSEIASRRANGGQASKTRTTDGLAPIPIITRSHGLPIPCHIASIAPPPPTSKTRRADETGTTSGRDGKRKRRERRADDETKTHKPRKTTSKHETQGETHGARQEQQGQEQASKQERSEKDRKTRTTHFLTSHPDPLLPALPHPSASYNPPPPGVGRAALVGSPRPPPIRCSNGFHHSRPASSALTRRTFSSPASSFITRRSR